MSVKREKGTRGGSRIRILVRVKLSVGFPYLGANATRCLLGRFPERLLPYDIDMNLV